MVGKWRLAVLAVYFIASCWLLFALGLPADYVGIAFSAFVLALMMAPILPLCLWPTHPVVNGSVAILVGGAGLLLILDALYFQPPDGQSALVFLFVPVLQLIAVGVFGIVFATILGLARNENGEKP